MIRTFVITIGDRPEGNVVIDEVDPDTVRTIPPVPGSDQVAADALPAKVIAHTAAGLLREVLPPDWGGGALSGDVA